MFSAVKECQAFSINERRSIFVTELLKSGVEPRTAVEVARIVADEIPDEQLTSEQRELVKAACLKWLEERKRQQFIDQVLQSFA
jgi:hypothetical protein